MGMAFTHAGVGDLDKGGLLEFGDVFCTTIAHTRTEPADELVDDLFDMSFIGYPAFDALRDIFLYICFGILEVAVAAAGSHAGMLTRGGKR